MKLAGPPVSEDEATWMRNRHPVHAGAITAECFDPGLHHRRSDTFYDPFLRLWRNVYAGPAPERMETLDFLSWVSGASEEELEAFAEGRPLPFVLPTPPPEPATEKSAEP